MEPFLYSICSLSMAFCWFMQVRQSEEKNRRWKTWDRRMSLAAVIAVALAVVANGLAWAL